MTKSTKTETAAGDKAAGAWSILEAESPWPYNATAERDGRFWLLRVPERDLVTQAVRLDQAEAMVRDLIATIDEVPPDSFDVRIRVKLGEPADDALEALEYIRLIDALAADLTRTLAVTLVREHGLSLRDVGRIIGLSHQRVDQLLAEHDAMGGELRPGLGYVVELIDHWTARRASVTIRPGDGPEKLEQLQGLIGKDPTTTPPDEQPRRGHTTKWSEIKRRKGIPADG